MSRTSTCVLAGVLSLAPVAAMADLITWTARGTISDVGQLEESLTTPIHVSVGDAYTFEFTFDTAIPDQEPDPWRGRFPNAVSARFTVGTESVGIDKPGFNAYSGITANYEPCEPQFICAIRNTSDSVYVDAFPLSWDSIPAGQSPTPGTFFFTAAWGLNGPVRPGPLSSDAIPSADTLAEFDFGSAGITVFGEHGYYSFANGLIDSVTSATTTPVPEPSTGLLFLAGLGGLIALRRRSIVEDRLLSLSKHGLLQTDTIEEVRLTTRPCIGIRGD